MRLLAAELAHRIRSNSPRWRRAHMSTACHLVSFLFCKFGILIHMSKSTKIIIGILVAMAVALVILLVFFDKAQAPQNTVINQPIPSDWQTFTDPISGISLQAPSDLTATSGINIFSGTKTFSLIIPTTTPYVNTHLLHEARIDVDTPTTTCAEQPQNGQASSTQVTIDGVIFTRILTGDVGAGNLYQGIDYTTTRNGFCYSVSLFTHSTNGEGFYTNDKIQIQKIDALQKIDIQDLFTLFDQSASTIKFTK